jgi:hypothetical protein
MLDGKTQLPSRKTARNGGSASGGKPWSLLQQRTMAHDQRLPPLEQLQYPKLAAKKMVGSFPTRTQKHGNGF